MKKTKLKLKKSVWIIGIVIIFLGIGLYAGINVYKDIQYKKTDEYKLLQVGYTKEEIKKLQDNLDNSFIKDLITTEKNNFLLELLDTKYYLKNNLNTYLEYYNEHKDFSPDKIVTYVNTLANYDYYDKTIPTDMAKDYLLLVNKYHYLGEDYIPDDLVDVNNTYYYGDNHKIRKSVYEAFKKMWEEAHKEGIYLIINSSFRTYDEQKEVYDDYENSNGTTYADQIAARPGFSEHQTGLAIDVFSKDATTTSNFKDSTAYLWLQNNAHRFGFIERYQEGKEEITGFAAEAWHWRYVGVEAATYIHDNNITFDEYYAYFIENN